MLRRVNDLTQLREFLHVTVLCAPDKFPKRDFLQPEDQLTLSKAFEELTYGLQFVENRINSPDKIAELRKLLAAALDSYKQGESIKGAHLLQDFEDMVFGKPSYRP